ncbi:hypothetical protein Plhal703r1_c71g0171471 [Plasmopara halstedii]
MQLVINQSRFLRSPSSRQELLTSSLGIAEAVTNQTCDPDSTVKKVIDIQAVMIAVYISFYCTPAVGFDIVEHPVQSANVANLVALGVRLAATCLAAILFGIPSSYQSRKLLTIVVMIVRHGPLNLRCKSEDNSRTQKVPRFDPEDDQDTLDIRGVFPNAPSKKDMLEKEERFSFTTFTAFLLAWLLSSSNFPFSALVDVEVCVCKSSALSMSPLDYG